jgi:hypothetical protein
VSSHGSLYGTLAIVHVHLSRVRSAVGTVMHVSVIVVDVSFGITVWLKCVCSSKALCILSVFSIYIYTHVWKHMYVYEYIYIYIHIYGVGPGGRGVWEGWLGGRPGRVVVVGKARKESSVSCSVRIQ